MALPDNGYKPVRRVYFTDSEGELCAKVLADTKEIDSVITANQQRAAEFRPHQKGLRMVARVPNETMLKWLNEEGVPGWLSAEAIDHVVNKKLRDPDNKYLLTVPDNYRMMKHG